MLDPSLFDKKLPFTRRLQVAIKIFTDASSKEDWMLGVVRDLLVEYQVVKQNKEQMRILLTRALDLFAGNMEILSSLIVDFGEANRYDEVLTICRDPSKVFDLALASDHFIDAMLLSNGKVELEGWRGIVLLGLMGKRRFKIDEVKPLATAFGQQHAHVKHSLVSIYLWVRQHSNALHFAMLFGISLPPGHRNSAICFLTMLMTLPVTEWPDDLAIWSNLCAQLNDCTLPESEDIVALKGNDPLEWLKCRIGLRRCPVPAHLATFIVKRGNVYRLGEHFIETSTPSTTSSPSRKPPTTPNKSALPSIADLKERLSTLQRMQPEVAKSVKVNVDGLIVLDTNILMSSLEWTEAIERPIQLVIPMAVWSELNSLLNRPDKATRAAEALKYLETSSVRYLHSDGTLLPKPSEDAPHSSPSIRNNDDVILMSTLLLRNANGENVCLVSDDVNMQLKGEAMQIPVINRRQFIGLVC